MGRTVLAVFAGLTVALVAMLAMEFLSMRLWPPPPGLRLDNEADLARLVALAPTAAKAMVVVGWMLASFLGAATAAKLARKHRLVAALAVGVFIVLGVAFNSASIPHPAWMTVLGLLLPLPTAWAAWRVVAPGNRDTR